MTAVAEPDTFKCGHPRTETNTYWDPRAERLGRPDPARCRTCKQAQKRASNRRIAVARSRKRTYKTVRREGTPTVIRGSDGRYSVMNLDTADRANCHGADINVFFPIEHERGVPDRAWDAFERYCNGCPVADECAATATAGRYEGLWGGQWRRSGAGDYRITPLRLDKELDQ